MELHRGTGADGARLCAPSIISKQSRAQGNRSRHEDMGANGAPQGNGRNRNRWEPACVPHPPSASSTGTNRRTGANGIAWEPMELHREQEEQEPMGACVSSIHHQQAAQEPT